MSRDMTALHEGKKRAKERREREALQAKQDELAKAEERLPTLFTQYEDAFKKACNTKGIEAATKAWNRADALQNACISTGRRIEILKEELS